MDIANKIATSLLDIKAVKISVDKPFTWASGWKSPIYCDNRKILSYTSIRKLVYKSFASYIKIYYPQTEVIAGVAIGAVAHGVLVAEELNLPFVYVRPNPKSHGLGNIIEGDLTPNTKIVVIEDLISTGASSLAAVEALRDAGCRVLGLIAIFSYDFDVAQQNFFNAECEYMTLSNYSTLLEEALKNNYIRESDLAVLQKWRLSPENYSIS
jgi:orotate phosphoribosyltransferase